MYNHVNLVILYTSVRRKIIEFIKRKVCVCEWMWCAILYTINVWQLLLEVARTRNSNPLPPIKVNQYGIRLPPDRYCLSACNYRIKPPRKVCLPKLGGRENTLNVYLSIYFMTLHSIQKRPTRGWPRQKSFHLSLSKHSLLPNSIPLPLSATLVHVLLYSILPSYNWPSSFFSLFFCVF